jgi:hypothetical protein
VRKIKQVAMHIIAIFAPGFLGGYSPQLLTNIKKTILP